ncbi:hypothetical protein P879_04463 [Paragonimus westermani]|uniref:Dynein light chain n=1 Tax=Paragonimus westermani TaxID=34504 RepID=A0A8T0DV42_9TREM|nr:hypothetical protein P879_04463 [Paragonimus westermani]
MSGRHTKELVQSDMSADMQEFVINACEEAFQLFQMEKDVANYLKHKMRKRYHGCWHCIVGEKFGSSVTYEPNTFINLYFDRYGILVFKT